MKEKMEERGRSTSSSELLRGCRCIELSAVFSNDIQLVKKNDVMDIYNCLLPLRHRYRRRKRLLIKARDLIETLVQSQRAYIKRNDRHLERYKVMPTSLLGPVHLIDQ